MTDIPDSICDGRWSSPHFATSRREYSRHHRSIPAHPASPRHWEMILLAHRDDSDHESLPEYLPPFLSPHSGLQWGPTGQLWGRPHTLPGILVDLSNLNTTRSCYWWVSTTDTRQDRYPISCSRLPHEYPNPFHFIAREKNTLLLLGLCDVSFLTSQRNRQM